MFSNLIQRIRQWYVLRYVPFVALCCDTESVYISRALWRLVLRAVPSDDRSELRVFFEKYPFFHYTGQGSTVCSHRQFTYRFFVNSRHARELRTPSGEPPFQAQIQISRYGHIGFQSLQPTPFEVLIEYGIADSDFMLNKYDHPVRLRVLPDEVEGEPCFIITSQVIP